MLSYRGVAAITVIWTALLAVMVALLAILVSQNVQRGDRATGSTATLNTYQAVLLSNGLAYFGKVEKIDSAYVILRDVYYIQSRVNQETKEVSNVLVKRGKEDHRPDRMIINANQILLMEPISPDSRVAKVISDLSKQ